MVLAFMTNKCTGMNDPHSACFPEGLNDSDMNACNDLI